MPFIFLFSTCNIIVEEGKRSTERFILSYYLQHDDEGLNMEPTVKVRPQIACLNEKPQSFQWLRPIFSQIQLRYCCQIFSKINVLCNY